MKIHNILAEMSWPDKFHQLEQKIRSSNMTMQELMNYLEKEYKIAMLPQFDLDTEAYSVGNASMTPLEFTADQIDPNAAEEAKQELSKLIGMRIFQVEIGSGVDGDTPVKEVTGFLHTLRHELSHYQQGTQMSRERTMDMSSRYVDADSQGGPLAPQTILYALQPIERPAQAVDLAHYLAQINSTPERFIDAVDDTRRGILAMAVGGDDLQEIARQIAGLAGQELADVHSQEDANELYNRGHGMALRIIRVLIAQHAFVLVIAGLMNDDEQERNQKKKIRGQIHQFHKILVNRFPKVKGYYSQMRDDEIESHMKNNDLRAKLEAEKQLLISMIGDGDIADLIARLGG